MHMPVDLGRPIRGPAAEVADRPEKERGTGAQLAGAKTGRVFRHI
jgi:hypothetical protein